MTKLTRTKKAKSILKALAATLNEKVEGNIQRVGDETSRSPLQRVASKDPPPQPQRVVPAVTLPDQPKVSPYRSQRQRTPPRNVFSASPSVPIDAKHVTILQAQYLQSAAPSPRESRRLPSSHTIYQLPRPSHNVRLESNLSLSQNQFNQ